VKPKRSSILQELNTSIMKGDTQETVRLIELGLKNNMSSQEIMDNALIPASKRIAEEFRGADFYIPDVLFALRPIKTGLTMIKNLSTQVIKYPHKIVIATVAGDIHDIGKNMVAIFLQVNGYEVIDLGVDVPAKEILQAVVEHKPAVLALSSLLTTTMGEMAIVIEILENKRLRRSLKVIVGGGPVSENFAEFIGADGYSPNALETVNLVKNLIS
jgi:5-methyltetrahydrofolate--homocysteine methyltransferase